MSSSQSGRKSPKTPKTPKTPKSNGAPVRPSDNIPGTTLPEHTSLFRTIVLTQGELVPLFQTKLGSSNVNGLMSSLGISGEGALRFAPSINSIPALADSAVLPMEMTTKQQLDDQEDERPTSKSEDTRSTTPADKKQEQTSTGRKTGGEKEAPANEDTGENVDAYPESDILSMQHRPRSVESQRKELTGSRSAGISGGYAQNEAAAIVRYYVHRQPKLASLREDRDAFRYLVKAYIEDETTLNEFVLNAEKDEDRNEENGEEESNENSKKSAVEQNVTSKMLSDILKDHEHLLTRSIIRAMQNDGFEGWWLKEPNGQEELLLFNPRAHVYASDVQLQHPQKSLQTIQLIFAHPNGQGTPMTFRLSDTIEDIRNILVTRYPALAQASEIGLQLGEHMLDEAEDTKTVDELNIRNNSLIHVKPGGGSDPKKQKGTQKKKK